MRGAHGSAKFRGTICVYPARCLDCLNRKPAKSHIKDNGWPPYITEAGLCDVPVLAVLDSVLNLLVIVLHAYGHNQLSNRYAIAVKF